MKIKEKSILVVGLAQTGVAVANFCTARGAKVCITDSRDESKLKDWIEKLDGSPKLECGFHNQDSFNNADFVVMSPGVPNLPEMDIAREHGVPVIAEIEFAYRFLHPDAKLIAITGTNGKSTTTALAGSLCQATGKPTFCGGNLGNITMMEVVDHPANSPGGYIVIEVAGFMLENCTSFKPDVGACLNITPDHLERFKTLEHYANIKNRIYAWQDKDNTSIGNANDPLVLKGFSKTKGKKLLFDSKNPVEHGAYYDKDKKNIVLKLEGKEEVYPVSDLPMIGNHNIENAMASYIAARSVGVSPEAIREGAKNFIPQKHRMEKVATQDGVVFFDDSKGTNVAAVAASLNGFPYPVVLIAGGKDKGGSYAPLFDVFSTVAKALILIGEAAPIIYKAAQSSGASYPIKMAKDMDQAVEFAKDLADSGDAVVLSPACSSYDMYKNFGERGIDFRRAVNQNKPSHSYP